MAYTVKQLAEVAGVSVRTLHYYDEIGLLRPTSVGQNGYRYYGENAVLRLQQILFFRELDFSLADIGEILDRPNFDMLTALAEHKRALQERKSRLNTLIQTIDRTILHLKGDTTMANKELFAGFDESKQAEYEQEIEQRFGDKELKESRRRWGSYTAEQKQQMSDEGLAIYQGLIARIDEDPGSPAVQELIARWHNHLRWFYEPTPETLQGLGQAYSEHPDFAAFYRRMHPQMPEFLSSAIAYYCTHLPVEVSSGR